MDNNLPGAVVISLDFEMHWGMFDKCGPDGPYIPNILAEREVVPQMLSLFREFDAAATWATVGLLFANNREHARSRWPSVRPDYRDPALDAYRVEVGACEADDPLHYAPGLIQQVARTPRQEIATHTFSHFYCREPGASVEAFREDLRSAVQIGADHGFTMQSIVFPRNQVNPEFLPVLAEFGIHAYRGVDPHWMYRAVDHGDEKNPAKRIARLLDRYVNLSGHNLTQWRDVVVADGLCNVPSTRYLQGWTGMAEWERLRLAWIQAAIRQAAQDRSIVHLWWHPHDFGADTQACMDMLGSILTTVRECRNSHGLQSLTMADVSRMALAAQ